MKGFRFEPFSEIVVRSSMPQDVGVQGIVLLEGRDVLYIITDQNAVNKIVKNGRVFEVVGLSKEKRVLLNGDALCKETSYQIPKRRHGGLNHNPFK